MERLERVRVAGGGLTAVGCLRLVDSSAVESAVDLGGWLGVLAAAGDDLVLWQAGEVQVEGSALGVVAALGGAESGVVAGFVSGKMGEGDQYLRGEDRVCDVGLNILDGTREVVESTSVADGGVCHAGPFGPHAVGEVVFYRTIGRHVRSAPVCVSVKGFPYSDRSEHTRGPTVRCMPGAPERGQQRPQQRSC